MSLSCLVMFWILPWNFLNAERTLKNGTRLSCDSLLHSGESVKWILHPFTLSVRNSLIPELHDVFNNRILTNINTNPRVRVKVMIVARIHSGKLFNPTSHTLSNASQGVGGAFFASAFEIDHNHCEKPKNFLKVYNELGKVNFFQLSVIQFRGGIKRPPTADRVKFVKKTLHIPWCNFESLWNHCVFHLRLNMISLLVVYSKCILS